ncbi:serine/threonine-protein kinase [Microbulbifer aggregans]|uniref:serine/threonine-protein kinase n=1 Tax=Microbulbifer aggregans TaxID=1769779 RepID=UPI001CFF10EF|nr:serine/threonine-protein kinase [Microbulbifer aggregans]
MTHKQPPFYIGRYLVTGKLGSGGMGVVYLATDERLQRKVAIKQLLSNPNSRNAHKRIRREALLLAQLNHSNIVQIYDVVESDHNIALVMEYIDGCSLERWQRERTPDLIQKLQLLKQICAGLGRAHAAGIIHRDLKGENILVDSSNTVKITDFGIAKSSLEDSDLTREQHIAGSWGAMSPEQAQGKPLDHRSDLFALGVLAYRLLCGQNPFGDNKSPYVIVDRIVNSAQPPAAKLCPDLPPALCNLLDRLLAKAPEQRPVNATAVAEELDAVLKFGNTNSFTRTHSLTATVTTEEFFQQRRGFAHKVQRTIGIVAGALGLGAAVTAGIWLWDSTPMATSQQYIAVTIPAMTNPSREQQLLSSNVQGALKQGLSGRKGLNLIPFTESQRFHGQPLAQQARSLNTDLLLVPDLQCAQHSCELTLELVEAEKLAVIASRSTRLTVDESLGSRARTLQQLDYLLPDNPSLGAKEELAISAENYQAYLELYEQRLDYRNLANLLDKAEQLQREAPTFTPLYELYTDMVVDLEDNSRSAEAPERLERILRNVPAQIADSPAVLTTRLRLALFRNDVGKTEALLERLKLVLPDEASYYFLNANYHDLQGNYEKALEEIDKALALRTSYSYLHQKALTLTLTGDMPAANAVLEQAIALNSESLDAISLLAANMIDSGEAPEAIQLLSDIGLDQLGPLDTYNLCMAQFVEKQYQESFECLERVIEMAPKDASPLLYQAEIADAQNRPQQAEKLVQRALEITADRTDWEGVLMRALAHADLGEAEEAVADLMKIRREAPDDLYVNYARSQIYMGTGDLLSAKAHIRKALEQGSSAVWYCTPRFAKICTLPAFDDLRQQYPELCSTDKGNSQIARSSDETPRL